MSRRIKELWVFGPLGRDDPDQKAKEEQITKDVKKIAQVLDGMEGTNMTALAERLGGSWGPLRDDEQGPEKSTGSATMAPSSS